MSQEFVTVVIPSKNRFAELTEAVASVAAQTVPARVFLVDDSTEVGIEEVVKQFSDRIEIQVLKNEAGGGIAGARNWGLSKSKTEYIAFLDSDDVWKPDFLEKSLKVLTAQPDCVATIALSKAFFTGHFPFLDKLKIQAFSMIKSSLVLLQYFFLNKKVSKSCPFVCQISHMLFRRGAISQFPGEWKVAEDWALFVDLLKNGDFQILPEVLLNFRFSYQSNSFNLNKNGSKNKKKYYELLIKELSDVYPFSPFVLLFRFYTAYLIIGE